MTEDQKNFFMLGLVGLILMAVPLGIVVSVFGFWFSFFLFALYSAGMVASAIGVMGFLEAQKLSNKDV